MNELVREKTDEYDELMVKYNRLLPSVEGIEVWQARQDTMSKLVATY